VRPGHELSEADVKAHCRTELADYKAPRTVLFLDEIQRTPVGKADYTWAKKTALDLIG
jgi:acyl-CoA synthetase (AMP-forming)/AMP-acid ligase II